jgi:adenylate cyclase
MADAPEPQPLDAIAAIRRALDLLNRVRATKDEPPLRHALCLHLGRVLCGNIGSSERLDFTIIGEAVNLTARCLEKARELAVDLVLTAEFARRFNVTQARDLGTHRLRDIAEPMGLLTPV